jgi:hypothetical protein
MNPIIFALRHPITILVMIIAMLVYYLVTQHSSPTHVAP